jgi:hypothetical protein
MLRPPDPPCPLAGVPPCIGTKSFAVQSTPSSSAIYLAGCYVRSSTSARSLCRIDPARRNRRAANSVVGDRQHYDRAHGGQIRFALGNRQWSPANLLTPFAAGMYRLPLGLAASPSSEEPGACPQACAFLYVNPGLGTFALPLRLGMPPEITVLMLQAETRARLPGDGVDDPV